MLNLVINHCNLNNKHNKFISAVLKSKGFHDYNREMYVQVPDMVTLSIMDKEHFKFIKWYISPKIKETHFKILHEVNSIAEFQKKKKVSNLKRTLVPFAM